AALFEQSLETSRRVGDKRVEATALVSLANVNAQVGNKQTAIEQCCAGLVLHEETANTYSVSEACLELGKLHARQGQIAEAREYLTRASRSTAPSIAAAAITELDLLATSD